MSVVFNESRMDRLPRMDWWLLAATLVLMGLGLIMVLSASGIMAEKFWGDKYLFFRKQFLYAVAGLVVMGVAASVPRRVLYGPVYVWLGMALALLALTVATPLGQSAGGATRWLHLGPLAFQPLEFAKPALVFYLAYFFSHKQDKVKTFSVGFMPPVLVTGALCLLLLLQPDFGGAVVMAAILLLMSLAGGTRFAYLGGSVLAGLWGGWMLITRSQYRMTRLSAFLDPFAQAQDAGYQIVQSLYAFGSGGWLGTGLGAGRQKLLFLPEAHNDFILAVMGEELGFVGLSLLFCCLGLLLWRAFRVALAQSDDQDRFAGFGMALILCLGAVLNLAVVLGTVPPKGVPMPFLSYGGSSLLASCLCVGVLLNLSRRPGTSRGGAG